MPRMEGSELYLEVKKISPDIAKRIIFASATLSESDFVKSTGNKFLQKPFTSEELIEAVRGFIKHIGTQKA
jgi:DNA-binding response OmpR family regulator